MSNVNCLGSWTKVPLVLFRPGKRKSPKGRKRAKSPVTSEQTCKCRVFIILTAYYIQGSFFLAAALAACSSSQYHVLVLVVLVLVVVPELLGKFEIFGFLGVL